MTQQWKAVERAVARKLHGDRVGASGLATPDVTTDWLSIEVKSRKMLPQWLTGAMKQSERNAGTDTLAIVVLHEKRQAHDQDLVVLRLGDFQAWFGRDGP